MNLAGGTAVNADGVRQRDRARRLAHIAPLLRQVPVDRARARLVAKRGAGFEPATTNEIEPPCEDPVPWCSSRMPCSSSYGDSMS
jgi:hypothetical protein